MALTCSALAATACSGDEGNGEQPVPESTPPSISDVSCTPSTVEASVDEQRIDFAFSFTDPEGDVEAFRGWLTPPGQEPVPNAGNATRVDSGATEGLVEGFFQLTELSGNDEALGNWTFEVAAVDGAGSESNRLTCTVTVFESR